MKKMKKLLTFLVANLVLIFCFSYAIWGQQEKTIKFTDNSELQLTTEKFYKNHTLINIYEKEAEGFVRMLGKSISFSPTLLATIRKRDKNLYKNLKRISSAFGFNQQKTILKMIFT